MTIKGCKFSPSQQPWKQTEGGSLGERYKKLSWQIWRYKLILSRNHPHLCLGCNLYVFLTLRTQLQLYLAYVISSHHSGRPQILCWACNTFSSPSYFSVKFIFLFYSPLSSNYFLKMQVMTIRDIKNEIFSPQKSNFSYWTEALTPWEIS